MPDRHKTRRHLVRELEKTRRRLEELEAVAAAPPLDGIPDLVCRVLPDTTLIAVNDSYAAFVGRSREQLLGRSFLELLPEGDRERIGRLVGAIGSEESRPSVEHRVVDASGRARWLEWNSRPVLGPDGEVVEIIAAGRDVTERRHDERAGEVLRRISEAAHSAASLDHLYRSIHSAVADLIDAPNFYIALLDPDRERIEFPYWSDLRDPPHPDRPLEHGLTEYVLRNARPLLAGPGDLEELDRTGEARARGEAPRYWLGVPLESEAGVFGVLAVFSYDEAPGDMRQAGELLRFVSQQVADAIRRREAGEARAARARQLDALRRVGLELAAELDLGTLLDSITDLATRLLKGDAGDLWLLKGSPPRLEQAATALCLPPLDADVKKLSGGERRRVALCKLLMSHPDILLLDEPTNHLDAETIEWLEQHLKEYAGTVILITHDRYFLDNVVEWMLEVERGQGTPYKGNYSSYLEQKQKLLDVKRQADSRIAKTIAREREWLGRTPKARTTQSKARVQRLAEMEQQRAEERIDEIELRLPPGPRLGDKVIEFREVTKGYGERVLIRDLSFDLPRNAIVGVVGPNGMGKTTMLRMILGQEEPDAGTITIGDTVNLTYLDQSRVILDDDKSVYDNITEGNDLIPFGPTTIDGRAYVARFNFKGEDQQRLLGECSGGMRNRVLLARMLKNAANVVLLDEPTNDLDLDTLRVLEEALINYVGSAIVVSHDRYFLNRVVSHIIAFEGDGYVNFHHGTYEDYAEWREGWRERMGFGPESRAGRYRKLLRS